MNIKILGTGCSRCKSLELVTRNAVAEMGLTANVNKEEDIVAIMNYGVIHTPALVIDEKVVLSGRVPSLTEIKEVLSKYNK